MKKRICMFVLCFAMILGLSTALVNCDIVDGVAHEVKYYVEGEVYYSQTVYSASEISLPNDPSRVDYDFAGWFYDEDQWQRSFNLDALEGGLLSSNIVVYAKWVPHQHKVSNGSFTKEDGQFKFSGKCDGYGTSCDVEYKLDNVTPKETVILRATCLVEGSSKYTYTHLGVDYSITEITPKGNHAINQVDVSALVDENGYFSIDIDGVHVNDDVEIFNCGDTAPGMFICSDCGGYVDITVVKSHQYNTWTMTPVGSGDKMYYEISSTCERPDCDHVNEYAAEERFLTENVNVEPNCISQGLKTVTYNNGKITVNCEVVLDKTAHIYNGKPITSYASTNGAYNYYDANGNVVFDKNFANIPTSKCGDVFDTYFECEIEECGQIVSIDVYKNHHLDAGTVITAATCISDGIKKFECSDCDYSFEQVINATGHTYNYTLTRIEDNDNDYTNDVFTYAGTCKDCGIAGESVTVAYNDPALKHTLNPASCTATGTHVYSYKKASVTVEIPKNDEHILNNVIAKYVLAGKDGVTGEGYSYKLSIPGIKIFADEDYACSVFTGKLYNGYYYCEACNQIVNVKVFVDHLGDRTTVSQPTCNTDGSVTVDCVNCGDDQITTIVPTGIHTYAYGITINENDATGALVYLLERKCSVCGVTDYTELEPADIKIEVKTEVSCKNKGVLSYTYTNGDITAYTERVYAERSEHTLNSEKISALLNSNGYLESNVPGVILPAGAELVVGEIIEGAYICEECGSSVKIQVLIVDSNEEQ